MLLKLDQQVFSAKAYAKKTIEKLLAVYFWDCYEPRITENFRKFPVTVTGFFRLREYCAFTWLEYCKLALEMNHMSVLSQPRLFFHLIFRSFTELKFTINLKLYQIIQAKNKLFFISRKNKIEKRVIFSWNQGREPKMINKVVPIFMHIVVFQLWNVVYRLPSISPVSLRHAVRHWKTCSQLSYAPHLLVRSEKTQSSKKYS